MKHSKQIRAMVLSAMFLALGLVLPFFTGQIPQIGGMLLPMHIPAFLCGLICGWQFGVVVGFIMPLLRMVLFGMPPLMTAVAMAFELAAYAGIAGFLYSRSRWQCVVALYRSLIAAMIGGRLVWAAVRVVMTGVASVPFNSRHHSAVDLHPRADGGAGPHRHGALPPGAGGGPGSRKVNRTQIRITAGAPPVCRRGTWRLIQKKALTNRWISYIVSVN